MKDYEGELVVHDSSNYYLISKNSNNVYEKVLTIPNTKANKKLIDEIEKRYDYDSRRKSTSRHVEVLESGQRNSNWGNTSIEREKTWSEFADKVLKKYGFAESDYAKYIERSSENSKNIDNQGRNDKNRDYKYYVTQAKINKSGIKETFAYNKNTTPEKIQSSLDLKNIIENGVYGYTIKDTSGKPLKIHNYFVPIKYNGENKLMRVAIKEAINNNAKPSFYYHQIEILNENTQKNTPSNRRGIKSQVPESDGVLSKENISQNSENEKHKPINTIYITAIFKYFNICNIANIKVLRIRKVCVKCKPFL